MGERFTEKHLHHRLCGPAVAARVKRSVCTSSATATELRQGKRSSKLSVFSCKFPPFAHVLSSFFPFFLPPAALYTSLCNTRQRCSLFFYHFLLPSIDTVPRPCLVHPLSRTFLLPRPIPASPSKEFACVHRLTGCPVFSVCMDE